MLKPSIHFGPAGSRMIPVAMAVVLLGLVSACGGGGHFVKDPPAAATSPGDGAPTITTQPSSVSIAAGGNATFSVTAQGTGLAYQWMRSTDKGQNWVAVGGATGSSYTVTHANAAASADQYRVVIQNAMGTVTSAAATLTVTGAAGAGGGTAGSVPAACVPPDVLPVGMVIDTTSALDINGTSGTPQRATLTVVGPSSFQGRSAFEARLDNLLLVGTTRTFTSYDATSRVLTILGAIQHVSANGIMVDSTLVARQPASDLRYTLDAGQSATTAAVADVTQTTTVNGVSQAPETSVSSNTTRVTFVGTEAITVPAGTFLTCKYTEQDSDTTEPTTSWIMAGYGATVKSVTGSVTQTLTGITVNGTPLTQFP